MTPLVTPRPLPTPAQLAAARRTAQQPSSPFSPGVGIDNFLRLMQKELADPLKRIGELAGRMDELRLSGHVPATLSGEQIFAELAETSRSSARVADRLISLGEVLSRRPILDDERILLIEVLSGAAIDVGETARTRRVGIRFDENSQLLAPIYGSRQWLGMALRYLMECLIESAPPGAHVLSRIRQVGFHQLITAGTQHGHSSPGSQDLLRSQRAGLLKEVSAAGSVGALDIVLARAIVELHGGALKTTVGDQGSLSEFVLSLPTGETPSQRQRPSCGECPYMSQAEQFARDIGELLNTQAEDPSPLTERKG